MKHWPVLLILARRLEGLVLVGAGFEIESGLQYGDDGKGRARSHVVEAVVRGELCALNRALATRPSPSTTRDHEIAGSISVVHNQSGIAIWIGLAIQSNPT
ncbi:uncharacterized protein MYCFIDRAFT_174982 [Pseudocercospora fijiensis CIRAD86]|uniref:Secreted protein n=1 Tax=Pseudocercospora fijiensis (strain CIRAD86) TaxID=383855 RepID=M3AG39_PSEFD|nr:uncharacterized protein MYCFIDRAFT_174982 [Pseudocercospora fijiensis CIRAD86]EME83556.1 hypothetical protein MYCFIDRAFT_174982 [Pseudocercospora fijiensis CIRAD86]